MPDAEEQKLTKGKQMTSKSTEEREMQIKSGSSAVRGNRVEGVIKAPSGAESWKFETHSMKGGLLSHRTCLLCCRNLISHFLLPVL